MKVGTSVASPREVEQPGAVPLSESRRCVVDGLLTMMLKSSVDTRTRRIAAINAIIHSSGFKERPPVLHTVIRRKGPAASDSHTSPTAPDSKRDFPIRCYKFQCIFCLGDTCLTEQHRWKKFHSRGTLRRYWKECYLNLISEGPSIPCLHPACDTRLRHKAHLRNHAEQVHGTAT